MAGDRVEADGDAAGGDREADPAGEYAPVAWDTELAGPADIPVAPVVGSVGDAQVTFAVEQLTRLLSERSSRSGGRTVVVVPIDQRTLDAGRVALGDDLEKEMALYVARAVGAWKAVQDRRHGLIDQHGRKTS